MEDDLSVLKGIDAPDVLAVVKNLGGRENWERAKRGELIARIGEGGKLVLIKPVGELYNRNGRVIAPKGFSDPPSDVDRSFNLTLSGGREWHTFDLPSLNLVEHFDRIRPFVPADCGITLPNREEIIQFLVHCEAVRTRLRNDGSSRNILRGAHLPTILPKCEVNNHGALVEVLCEIAKRSYETQFPGRKFNNCLEGKLVGELRIAPESRFLRIRNRMSSEFVSGLTFFTPFQRYSTHDSRQVISFLPEECTLSCFDTIWDWVLYPEILLSSWKTHAFGLAGFFLDSSTFSPFGKVVDDGVYFDDRALYAGVIFSDGLFLSR